jgi:hypothetical protein
MDTYEQVEAARRKLSCTILELHRKSKSREASPDTLEETLQDVLNLPLNCLEQASFLAENNACLDITPLLAELGVFQDECRLISQEIMDMTKQWDNQSLDISTLQSTCRLLKFWLDRRMNALRQVWEKMVFVFPDGMMLS